MDVLDPLEPTAVLGGIIEEKKFSSKKGKKGKKVAEDDLGVGSHEAAVMALSWYERTSFPLFFLCLFFALLCSSLFVVYFACCYLFGIIFYICLINCFSSTLFLYPFSFHYTFLSFCRSQPSTLFSHHQLNFLFPPLLPILWWCLLAIIRLFLRNISSLFPSFLFLLSPSPSLDHPIIRVSLNFIAFLIDRMIKRRGGWKKK